jgi:hypothetical protein
LKQASTSATSARGDRLVEGHADHPRLDDAQVDAALGGGGEDVRLAVRPHLDGERVEVVLVHHVESRAARAPP